MLREADGISMEEALTAPLFAPAVAASSPSAPLPYDGSGGRYGDGRRFSPLAVALTIALHIALVAALFLIRDHITHKRLEKLTVLQLAAPAPPPPPSTPEPTRQVQVVRTPVVAPDPIVRTPTPISPIATTPEPSPPQPLALPPAPPAAGPPAPPAPPQVVNSDNIDESLLFAKPPRYPLESRRKREQGTVQLMLLIGYDGTIANISVNRTSGHDRLDQAALEAVRKWRWKPFMDQGQPVMIRAILPIPFKLTN